MARVVARLKHRAVSSAWQAWLGLVRQLNFTAQQDALRDAHEQQLRQLQSDLSAAGAQQLKRVTARWRLHGLSQAFGAWAGRAG